MKTYGFDIKGLLLQDIPSLKIKDMKVKSHLTGLSKRKKVKRYTQEGGAVISVSLELLKIQKSTVIKVIFDISNVGRVN